jgi:hypothetical protein
VDPRRIVVIANNVDPEALRNWDQRFQPISDGAARGGFTFVSVPVLQSDLFDLIKSETASVHDLAADDTDLRAQCAAEADSSKREAIGRKIVHRRMARSLSRNLQDVWKASPLAAAVQSVAA